MSLSSKVRYGNPTLGAGGQFSPECAVCVVRCRPSHRAAGPRTASCYLLRGETTRAGPCLTKLLSERVFSPQLRCLLFGPIVILEELWQLIPQHRDVGQGPHEGQLAIQVYHRLFKGWGRTHRPLSLSCLCTQQHCLRAQLFPHLVSTETGCLRLPAILCPHSTNLLPSACWPHHYHRRQDHTGLTDMMTSQLACQTCGLLGSDTQKAAVPGGSSRVQPLRSSSSR